MREAKTVKEMVQYYLIAWKYDGLVNLDGKCGCPTDCLAPCGQIKENCLAAYRHKPADCEKCSHHCEGCGRIGAKGMYEMLELEHKAKILFDTSTDLFTQCGI